MIKKVEQNLNNVHIEKVTNEPFDDIIGHSNNERKYFTIENNDIIYKRLKEETDIEVLPYLGPCVDYGNGDICLEETMENGNEVFKLYVIDRMAKFDSQEFYNIETAIDGLVNYYMENEMISDSERMKSIFMATLNLSKTKKLCLDKKHKNY